MPYQLTMRVCRAQTGPTQHHHPPTAALLKSRLSCPSPLSPLCQVQCHGPAAPWTSHRGQCHLCVLITSLDFSCTCLPVVSPSQGKGCPSIPEHPQAAGAVEMWVACSSILVHVQAWGYLMAKPCTPSTAALSEYHQPGRRITYCCTSGQWIGKQLCTSTITLSARTAEGKCWTCNILQHQLALGLGQQAVRSMPLHCPWPIGGVY